MKNNGLTMKIFIQHHRLLQFMRIDSEWTPDINEAMDFHFAIHAVKYGITHLRQPFLLRFKFEDPSLDFTLNSYAGQTTPSSRSISAAAV